MSIYEALKKDHRKLETLLDQLVEASKSGNAEWKSLLVMIEKDVVPHSRAEEAVFYNALRDIESTKGLVAHSYAEHATAEAELRALGVAKIIDANWTKMVEKLRKDLLHHIEQEEGKVFEAAKTVFSDEEANQIGRAFVRLKHEMAKDGTSMMASTIDLIANLLPTRITDSFRKNFKSHRKDAA